MELLETQNITYIYGRGTPFEKAALRDVSLSFSAGEFVGLIGHTGSGKSTLLQHLNGLLTPHEGRVLYEGRDIHGGEVRLRELRQKVGLVFQYPEYQLFEETVARDIAFGPKNMGLSAEEIDARVARAAEFVGLADDLLRKSPFELSGGEKRRAAIAGVLAMEPQVLILDEPTAGLDPRGRREILGQLGAYQKASGSTVVLSSHSMEDIARLADRVVVLDHGEVAMQGSTHDVFSRAGDLLRMGLSVPQVTRIFIGLRAEGIDIEGDAYTLPFAAERLLALFRGEGGVAGA